MCLGQSLPCVSLRVFLDFLIFTYLWLKAMNLELSLQYRRCSRLRSSSYSSLLLASLNRPSMIRSLSRQWDLAPMYCPGVFGRGPLKQSSIFHTTYSYTKFSKFPGRILLCFLIHKMKSNMMFVYQDEKDDKGFTSSTEVHRIKVLVGWSHIRSRTNQDEPKPEFSSPCSLSS